MTNVTLNYDLRACKSDFIQLLSSLPIIIKSIIEVSATLKIISVIITA